MYFNEKKYKKCINHLISIMFIMVLAYILVGAAVGLGIGFVYININEYDVYDFLNVVTIVSTSVGAILGLFCGISSIWKIEMKIQEAYWKIDVINELKKQTTMASKNTPIAKTVVAIENKQDSQERKEEKV